MELSSPALQEDSLTAEPARKPKNTGGVGSLSLLQEFSGIPQARILEWVSQSVSSVTQSCPTLCDHMNHSTPGLPAHHQLLESTQTHVHQVSDAIQPSHPLPSPSPPALSLSQHQGSFLMSQLFASGSQNIGVSASTSVLPKNTQD